MHTFVHAHTFGSHSTPISIGNLEGLEKPKKYQPTTTLTRRWTHDTRPLLFLGGASCSFLSSEPNASSGRKGKGPREPWERQPIAQVVFCCACSLAPWRPGKAGRPWVRLGGPMRYDLRSRYRDTTQVRHGRARPD